MISTAVATQPFKLAIPPLVLLRRAISGSAASAAAVARMPSKSNIELINECALSCVAVNSIVRMCPGQAYVRTRRGMRSFMRFLMRQ
jgi:hypothetical protein